MPTYNFLNTTTNTIEEHRMSYTVLDQFKLDNPNLELHIFAEDLPVFSDANRMSVPGTRTADGRFEREVIGRIKEKVPGNTLKERHKTKMPREW